MKNKLNLIILSLVLVIVLSGCTQDNSNLEQEIQKRDNEINQLEERINELESQLNDKNESAQKNLLTQVIQVIGLIKDKDMEGLSSYVHPDKGIRFSPYGYVDVDNDRVFTAEEVANLNEDTQVYTWGSYDGSGDPINLSFSDYYDRFIYDKDFANPHIIGNNVAVGQGNTINNIEEAYPDSHFIEFHFTGFDPQYSGMDWRSLSLIFEEEDGLWYLVGITHGEWTI